MKRNSILLKLVAMVVITSFLWSNVVWAAPMQSIAHSPKSVEKLAVQGQVGKLGELPLDDLGQLLRGNDIMQELGINSLRDIVVQMDELEKRGVICFVRPDKDDSAKKARYVFIREGIFLRITNKDEVVNDDFPYLLKIEGKKEVDGDSVFEWCFVTEENINLVNTVLSELNENWSVGRSTTGDNNSHLLPMYLYEVFRDRLVREGLTTWPEVDGFIKGISYTDDDGVIHVAKGKKNKKAAGVMAKVLSDELQQGISEEDVLEVLNLHERLHQIIKKKSVDVTPLLKKLRRYYAKKLNKKDPNDQEVTNEVNALLCSFARNYNYLHGKDLASNILTEREQLMLVEEMLVHEYIERHFFRQPVRLIGLEDIDDPQNKGADLPAKIEFIFFRELEPKAVVALFSELLGNEDKLMENYFLLLYELYLDSLVGKVPHLEIGRNFRPSAVLDDDAHRDKLGTVEYTELLRERGTYGDIAKKVHLILNPLDGGAGDAVVRDKYLEELKSKGVSVETSKYGAKGADMHIPLNSGGYISIMEAKLLKAIQDAKAGRYGFIECHLLGSEESKNSLEKILGFKCRMPDAGERTYRKYIKDHPKIMKVLETQLGIKVPAVDKATGCLTTENTGHGNHGLRGTYFFQEAKDHEIEEDETVIRVIYNGDGINNGVDPVIVGYMAEENIPVIMVTTTKTNIDKKGGLIGLQIIDEGAGRYKVQIMELAQAGALGEGQQRLFYDMGLESGGYIKDNQPGKQYFNTNTVLMNISVLKKFLQELINLKDIGIDEFRKAMAPVLIPNEKEETGKKFIQLEGALGSVVLSLAGYLDGTKNPKIKRLLKEHGIEKFLRIVNIDENNRNSFFTPFKATSDFWYLFYSGRYDFDEEKIGLADRYQGRAIPRFELENTYDSLPKKEQFYNNVTKLMDAFSGIDITGLTTLEIAGRPVHLNKSILKGRVTIFSIAQDKNKPVSLMEDRIKNGLIGKCGIIEQNERLVLDNVCILIGDNEVFVSEITEDEGELSATYFARQIYKLRGKGEDVPDILVKITEKLHEKYDLRLMGEPLPKLRTNEEASSFIKSITVFPYPKYDSSGRPHYFDGISVISKMPGDLNLNSMIRKFKDNIQAEDRDKGRFIANIAHGKEHLTVFNGVAMHNWKRKYEDELNEDTKQEIKTRQRELINTGTDEETALKKAVYEVVSKRIAEALKEFSAWERPVFKPYKAVLFPPDRSSDKTQLAVGMVPATTSDMAILTKMRDIIMEKTGLDDFVDFKKHITLGYFVDCLNDLEEYERFEEFLAELNNEIQGIADDRSFWFELPEIGLSFFTDMESFSAVGRFSWTDINHNKAVSDSISRDWISEQIRDVRLRRKPKAGPVGKITEEGAESVELWQAEVMDGELQPGKILPAGKGYSKIDNIKKGKLDDVLKRLSRVEENGPGILAVVDHIRVVDNISVDQFTGSPVNPYGMMIKEDGKNILLLDVDAFGNEELLYVVLEHALKESIMTIIPYENEAIRELTTNYMSLKLALEKGIGIDKTQLKELGADLQFFEALEVLRAFTDAGEEITDEKIIAVAIEHMRNMPYYEGLFQQFPFAGDWRKAMGEIEDAKARYEAALGVFNDIAEAKEAVKKVKKTAVEVDEKIKGLSKSIEKIRMIVSWLRFNEEFVDTLLEENKFIKLDVNELAKSENKYIVEWLQKMLEGKEESPFVFYGKETNQFLQDNNLKQGELPEGIKAEDVIDLIELSKVNDQLGQDSLYLPLLYSVSSIYLASQVVLAGGKVAEIQDKLAESSIRALYETLLGREITGGEWDELFRTPWTVLPPITQITATLDVLRKAIAQVEVAA